MHPVSHGVTGVGRAMTAFASFSCGRFLASGRLVTNYWATPLGRRTRVPRLFSSQDSVGKPKDVEELLMKSYPPIEKENIGFSNDRYAPDFTVYKKSGSINMKLIPPSWKTTPSGLKVRSREGTLLLEFAKSVGTRAYDWENKKYFAMSALELSAILAEPKENHEFFHDPNMNKSLRGSVIKVFKTQMAERGLFFNLKVKEISEEWTINVPVTAAEYKLFQVIAAYMVPFLMGFDEQVREGPVMDSRV